MVPLVLLGVIGCPSGAAPFLMPPARGPSVTLTAPEDLSFGEAIATGDLDGDGDADLAVTSGSGDTTAVFDGPVQDALTVDQAARVVPGRSATAADVDGDGAVELLTTTFEDVFDPIVHVWAGDGGERGQVRVIDANKGLPALAVGDVTDAPGAELVVAVGGYNGQGDDLGSRIEVFAAADPATPRTSDDAAAVLSAGLTADWVHALDVGDVTGDGGDEVLISFVGFNHASESYLLEAPIATTDDLEGTADVVFDESRVRMVGDIDGDGLEDLAGPSLDAVRFFTGGRPDPEAPTALVSGPNDPIQAEVFPAGDVDGDGIGDVVVVELGGGDTALFHGPVEGAAEAARVFTLPRTGAYTFELATSMPDLDADGGDEIVLGQAMDYWATGIGVVWVVGLP